MGSTTMNHFAPVEGTEPFLPSHTEAGRGPQPSGGYAPEPGAGGDEAGADAQKQGHKVALAA